MDMTSTNGQIPDVSLPGRSPTSILLQAFALAALTSLASSHLASLRRQPRKFATYQIFTTLIIPSYPFIEIVIGLYRTFRARTQANSVGQDDDRDAYLLCAAMDLRALPIASADNVKVDKSKAVINDNESSVPIHLIPARTLELEKQPYDIRWTARFFSLVILAVTALTMLHLWGRRVYKDARTYVDDYVALLSFAMLCIAVQAITISIPNIDWRAPSKYTRIFQERFAEPTVLDLLLHLTSAMDLAELKYAIMLALTCLEISFLTLRTHVNTPAWNPIYRSAKCARAARSKPLICVRKDKSDIGVITLMEMSTAAANLIFWITLYYCAFAVIIALLRVVVGRSRHALPQGRWSRHIPRELRFGGIYLLCWTGLLVLSVWDLTNYREQERWMWVDPLCSRLDVLFNVQIWR